MRPGHAGYRSALTTVRIEMDKENDNAYENFPFRLIVFSVLVNIAIYGVGVAILSGLGPLLAGLYLIYCIGVEMHVMKTGCVDCYYYGKWCAFGKGKVAPLFFKRGDPGRFIARTISWKDLLPDMFVVIIPVIGGIALLLQDFSWTMVLLISILMALSSGGNYVVRSKIACRYCKQRELGCPAEQLFAKKQ